MRFRTMPKPIVVALIGTILFAVGFSVSYFAWSKKSTTSGTKESVAIVDTETKLIPEREPQQKLPGPVELPPTIVPQNNQRPLLELALGAGGRAQISVNGKDKEVWQLKQMPQGEFHLQRLDLSQFKNLTAPQVQLINHLELLDYLCLQRTNITDHWLHENLRGLNRLTQLELGYTAVSGQGLSCLTRLPKLHSLWLEEVRLDAQAWETIGQHQAMKRLFLQQANLDDAGLIELSGLTNLVELNLTGTKITDAGLQHLRGMKNLGQLILLKTSVTEKGAKELAGHLPGCRIGYPGGIIQPK